MVIWLLDCSNGFVTKVNLSKERAEELEEMGTPEFIEKYADKFGVRFNDCSWMVTDVEYEVDEVDF